MLVFLPLWAVAETLDVRTLPPTVLQTLRTASAVPPEARLRDALKLGKYSSLRLRRTEKDSTGHTHRIYDEYYSGVRVEGGEIHTHTDTHDKPHSMNGDVVLALEQSISPQDAQLQRLSPAIAMQKAKAWADVYLLKRAAVSTAKPPFFDKKFSNEKIDVVIYQGVAGSRDAYAISYVVDSVQANASARPFLFIDADSGAVLKQWDGMAYALIGTGPGGNQKTGAYEYGTTRPYLDVIPLYPRAW